MVFELEFRECQFQFFELFKCAQKVGLEKQVLGLLDFVDVVSYIQIGEFELQLSQIGERAEIVKVCFCVPKVVFVAVADIEQQPFEQLSRLRESLEEFSELVKINPISDEDCA